MQALIIDERAERLDQKLIALMNVGVHVTGTKNMAVAETCISRMCVDLLIVDRSTIDDALGDTIGMAEEQNPYLVTVLRTPDVSGDQDALTPHFPSLHCVVGEDVLNSIALKIGLASLRNQLIGRLAQQDKLIRAEQPQVRKPLPVEIQRAVQNDMPPPVKRRLTLFAEAS